MRDKTALVFILTVLLEARLFVVYDLPPFAVVAFIITIIEMVMFKSSKKQMGIAGWWLYTYIFCAFLLIANFKFTPYRFTLSSSGIIDADFLSMAESTVIAYMFYFASLLFFCNPPSARRPIDTSYYAPNFKVSYVILAAFILTAISRAVGIGQMGVETTRLPFHLAGIIQFTRTDLIPVMVLCMYAYKKNRGQSTNRLLGLVFLWSVAEAFVRMSKSAILFCFLPIIMYELISDPYNYKSLIRKFAPVLVIILILYPVIETFRHTDTLRGAWAEADTDYTGTFTNPDAVNPIVKPFNRQFLSGYLLAVDQSYINNMSLFDFSRVPAILSSGGSAKYQTFVIDGYPEGVIHSSGTSPFIDSLLMGGYGLFYVSFMIMAFIAEMVDRLHRNRTNYVMIAILLVAYYRLFDMPLVTFFLNEMSIRYLIVYAGICLYINYKIKRSGLKSKI